MAHEARRRRLPGSAAGLSLGQYARSLVRRLAALTAVLLAAIWALTGQGYLWPAWAWLGLLVVVLLDYATGWVWRHPAGAPRRVACVWAAIGVAATILVATWLLTWLLADARTFWPAWALLGLATAGSSYSLIALHDRVLIANAGRALRRRTASARARSGAVRAFLRAQRRLARGGVVLDREAVTRLLAPDAGAPGDAGVLREVLPGLGAVGSRDALPGLGTGSRDALSGLGAGSRDALSGTGAQNILERLTARERAVLELMAEGRSNGAIAERLVVSLGAIEKHITNIFAKLELPACDDDHRRVLAVLAYLRRVAR